MHIYGEIIKIQPLDDGTIKVAGIASSGAVDDADETVLPAAMKAALPAYMRFGALREMHGLSAAGATLHAEVGEDGLTRIETHVVDPVAVKKVRLGVYKGFSIGGKVLERDASDRRVITKIKLDEISLVDRPCNPEAMIDMWKADRVGPINAAAPTNAEVIARSKALAAAAGKPGRHTDFVVKAREALIRDRAARAAVEASADADDEADDGPDTNTNTNTNTDTGSVDAAAIADQLDSVLADLDPQVAAEALADLVSRRSSNSTNGETAKATVNRDRFNAERLDRDVGSARLDDLRRAVASMRDRLDKLAAEPMAPKAAAGWARAISKTEDAAAGAPDGLLSAEEFKKYLDTLPEDERGQLQLRAALRSPIVLGGR